MERQLEAIRSRLADVLGDDAATTFLAQQLAELGLQEVSTPEQLFDLGSALCRSSSDVVGVGRDARDAALELGATGVRRDAAVPRLSVLLVDDDQLVIRVFVRCLKSFPVEVYVADSRDAARQVLRKVPLDVVATDDVMPDGSGERLLDTVATHHPDVTRLVFSGATRAHKMQVWREQGRIHGWLEKPFVAQELFDAIVAARQAHLAMKRV